MPGEKLKYTKVKQTLEIASLPVYIGSASYIDEQKHTLPIASSQPLSITSVIDPYFAVYEVYITLKEAPVTRWEKSNDTYTISNGHALIIDHKTLGSWVDGQYGDATKNDYNTICNADITNSAGIRHLQNKGTAFSFSIGSWKWHYFLGYDETGELVKIAFPFEKPYEWYETNGDNEDEADEINEKLASCSDPFVAEFISMNIEDLEKNQGRVIRHYDDAVEAFTDVYNTDWETTKLHLKSLSWNGFEFGQQFVEQWCQRNGIEMPAFEKARLERYYAELRANR